MAVNGVSFCVSDTPLPPAVEIVCPAGAPTLPVIEAASQEFRWEVFWSILAVATTVVAGCSLGWAAIQLYSGSNVDVALQLVWSEPFGTVSSVLEGGL